jgi:predicted TPR repeat methyltransferase
MTGHEIPSDDWLVAGGGDARDVADQYDAWAETYDTDLDTWSYRAPVRIAEAVLAHRPRASSVLDVGCGTGLAGRALRDAGYTGELIGLDISEAALEVARRSGHYATLTSADLQQPLPLDDDSVDVVVCVGVMTYLPDTEAVWREFLRVARPGGLVAVTQREDLWEPRACQGVIDALAAEGAWTPLEVSGPAAYLPEADGALGGLGAYYVTAEVS